MSETAPKVQLAFFVGSTGRDQFVFRGDTSEEIEEAMDNLLASEEGPSVLDGIMSNIELIRAAYVLKEGVAPQASSFNKGSNGSAPAQSSAPAQNEKAIGWDHPSNAWAQGRQAPTVNGVTYIPASGIGKNGKPYKAWCPPMGVRGDWQFTK